jgi:hypothetical protein
MDKQTLLTPFELELKAILDIPEPDTAFVQGLRGKLLRTPQLEQPNKKTGSRWISLPWGANQPGWVWVATAITLVVLAIFLSVGPERVLAAARHWLGGFIPGVGFVDNESNLRILEKPVQLSVEGAAIAVEKAYTNADETAIQIDYLNDSRTCKNMNVTYAEYQSRLKEKVYLLLPDGRKLFALTPRFSSWGKFPALPNELDKVVLVAPPNLIHPCATGDNANAVSATTFCQCMDDDLQWNIQLKFISPPPGSVLPVVDSATPTAFPFTTATAQPSAPTVTAQTFPAAPTANPVARTQPELVGKLVVLDDGYLFLVALKRDPNAEVSYSFGLNEHHFRLFDATGSEIQVEEVERSEVNPEVFKSFQWGDALLLRTRTKQVTGPLTLTFPTLVQAQYQFGKEAEFAIDLGASTQPGQHIPFQKSFDFIPGHPFTLREVVIDSMAVDGLGVTLTFAGQGYETILVNQLPFPDPPPQGGSSGQCADFPGCFYTSTSLIPGTNNQYRMAVSGVEHTVQGPWSLSFELEGSAP